MTEEEPLYFYKMMMTEGQHADLMAIIANHAVNSVSAKEKELLRKLALAVGCATKEGRE